MKKKALKIYQDRETFNLKKRRSKINLQDRKTFTERSKTVKIIKIKKAKIVKLSNTMIEKRALALRKLEMDYKIKKAEILSQEWLIINDKIVKAK